MPALRPAIPEGAQAEMKRWLTFFGLRDDAPGDTVGSPPSATTIGNGITIKGELRFQACSTDICEAPQAIPFALPLRVEAGIPPAPTKPA